MRRDHFTVATRNLDPDDGESPTLVIEYDGPAETLTGQLTDSGDPYPAGDIDAAFRLQTAVDADDASGVFSLAHRITGEFLLEVNVEAGAVLDLVRATRDAGEDDASYRIHLDHDEQPIRYEMDSLFVYDANGDLLRQHSLIPSGVEL